MISTQVSLPGYHVREIIYEGSRTVVYRGNRETDLLPVVIKLLKNPYPSFKELVQFRNQYTIAKSFNFSGIVKVYSLENYQNGYMLVMEDFEGISLSEWMGKSPLSLLDFLQIAISLCDILDILSRKRIIHKDIKPSNILINPHIKEVKLIDFSIASLLPKEVQNLKNINVLEGTLAYISPEQTGRMNRGIDYRTDFYSLGIVFHEMLTGKLPFQSEDIIELIHSQIAKTAPLLHEINPQISTVISEIVSKLMAKNAEDRYQSVWGLKFDLEKCLVQFQDKGKIESFIIAQRDLCDRFIIPEKLYGREAEVKSLLAAFERVSQGATEIMLVTGFSGIGKTAVVNEIHKPIVKQRGYFIKGKFDQFNRNIPFSAFVEAFRDLIGQLLTEGDAQLQIWQQQILTALGENGQVIIEVIPELERIIGKQSPIAELSGTAAENRFNLLFQKFTQIFTNQQHPLVIFLDDLQWADSASLKLIQRLIADTRHLFLIGAYRDNEVNSAHPLMLTLREVKKSSAIINQINLAPLSQLQVNNLVADTFKCSELLVGKLSKLVFQKTQGNPFFVTQFLKSLYQDQLIQFNFDLGCWESDIAQVSQLAVTDDVVAFMAFQLRRLPASTQYILQLAACIGNQFDLQTLAIVSEESQIETASHLWKALEEGLIVPTSNIYRFYVGEKNSITNTDIQDIQETFTYKFLHDRVQQAAYSLIPSNQTPKVHLQIGRLLLNRTPKVERESQAFNSQIFQIVNQLNCGIPLIENAKEREELAELNRRAGEKARFSSAYDAAMSYLNLGLELLQSQAWEHQYFLCLGLHQLAAEVAYLSADYDRMTKLIVIGLDRAKNDIDRVKFYETQILAFVAQNQPREAVDYARRVLRQFGVRLPQNPSPLRTMLGFFATLYRMSKKKPEGLLKLPPMTNPSKLAACQIFNAVGSAAASGMPEMLPFITFNGLSLYLRYGNIPKSSMGYIIYGYLLCEKLGWVDAGYAIGKAAIALSQQNSSQEALAPTLFLWHHFIAYRKELLHNTSALLLEAYQAGLAVGDIEYAAYSLVIYFTQAYWTGKNLADLQQEAIASRTNLQRLQQLIILDIYNLNCQVVENLCSGSNDVCELVGDFFDETAIPVDDVRLTVHTSFRKLQLAYLFDRHILATEQIAIIEANLDPLNGTFVKVMFYFYSALVWLARYPDLSKKQQKACLRRIKTARRNLSKFAKYAPTNYQHKWLLVEAEYLRVFKKSTQAGEYYDRAISLAKTNNYIQEAALANELTAKFYLHCDRENIACVYMQEAYYCYTKWGAKAKTDDLSERYPHLLQPILQPKPQPGNLLDILATITTPDLSISESTESSKLSGKNINQALDFAAILTASQTLASKIELDELLRQLSQIILKYSGGDRCGIILPNQDHIWQLEALATPETVEIASFPLEGNIALPVKLINYVKNTQEAVVIDALNTELPVIDDYLYQQQPQSLLCLPLLNQGKAIAILLLENQITSGVFSHNRLQILNFLSTQAAISLENAKLFRDRKAYEERLEKNNAELIRATRMKDEFLATMSHELRTPMNAILGMTEALQDEIFGEINAQQLKALATVERSGNHLLELINDILDVSKIASGQIELEYQSTEIIPLCQQSLEFIKPQAAKKSIQIVSQLPTNLPNLNIDERRIRQVLINLLNNAVKFTPEGGCITLEVIYPTTIKQQNYLQINVKDTGIGIAPENLNKVFEPFIQVDSALNRNYEGTGLGLALVKRIVEMHHGEVTLTSELGVGSCFAIALPS
ncbi:AAA family ATPase [Calothrix sp. 336/3]|uniref:AAA family ATPase n=1 Tax=Calothrix sp. 336/3 TaxID=1337936 RepID=UPI0004E3E6A6|nr:AAA family ATPase [Calothrix sp. 336/3]AKG20687.1 serine/threonine protein kinase [Calothrix sp. 336/3]